MIQLISLERLTPQMRPTEAKYLRSVKKSLLLEMQDEVSKFEGMAHKIARNKESILKIKETAKESPEYLEELEGKARISYLKKIIDDQTRDLRHENDEFIDLKRAKSDRIFILKEEIRMINEELQALR